MFQRPIDRDYFSDLFRGASARLECFKSKYIFGKRVPESDINLYGYGAADRKATTEELNENEKAWQIRLSRTEPKAIEKIQMKYPLAYLEKIVGLIKAAKINLVFLYLPEYGSKLTLPKHAEIYKNAGQLLIPPQFIFDDATNWMDAGHLNDKGAELLSVWLAGQLKNEL